MKELSKTQIDRLGNRLRKDPLNESDLRELDTYRRSFGDAYEIVVNAIKEKLNLEPTGRPAKSTGAIIEKLLRESIRLSQVQDIAGCRVVVADMLQQDSVTTSLVNIFSDATVVDRRLHPSFGYRAVHVIIRNSGKLAEVQIRTPLQHLWAELSEKFADEFDSTIKYGGGSKIFLKALQSLSELIKDDEEKEKNWCIFEQECEQLQAQIKDQRLEDIKERIKHHKRELELSKQKIEECIKEIIATMPSNLKKKERKS